MSWENFIAALVEKTVDALAALSNAPRATEKGEKFSCLGRGFNRARDSVGHDNPDFRARGVVHLAVAIVSDAAESAIFFTHT